MSNKKDLNKKELEKVTGGDFGRTWNISQFRQDYVPNKASSNDQNVPSDTQFKPEDVGAYQGFMNGNKQND